MVLKPPILAGVSYRNVAGSQDAYRDPDVLVHCRTHIRYCGEYSCCKMVLWSRNGFCERDYRAQQIKGHVALDLRGTSVAHNCINEAHHCRQAITVVEASLRGGRIDPGLLPAADAAPFTEAVICCCFLSPVVDAIVFVARDDVGSGIA